MAWSHQIFWFKLNFLSPKNESVLNILVHFLEQFQRFSQGLQAMQQTTIVLQQFDWIHTFLGEIHFTEHALSHFPFFQSIINTKYKWAVMPVPRPPPPCVDSFYTLSVDKNKPFFDPFPPYLVHVVIEWPLIVRAIFNYICPLLSVGIIYLIWNNLILVHRPPEEVSVVSVGYYCTVRIFLGRPQASRVLLFGQFSGHKGGSFFFTKILSSTIPKFRTYRRVFLFHQNFVPDPTKIQDIHEGFSFSLEFCPRPYQDSGHIGGSFFSPEFCLRSNQNSLTFFSSSSILLSFFVTVVTLFFLIL